MPGGIDWRKPNISQPARDVINFLCLGSELLCVSYCNKAGINYELKRGKKGIGYVN